MDKDKIKPMWFGVKRCKFTYLLPTNLRIQNGYQSFPYFQRIRKFPIFKNSMDIYSLSL